MAAPVKPERAARRDWWRGWLRGAVWSARRWCQSQSLNNLVGPRGAKACLQERAQRPARVAGENPDVKTCHAVAVSIRLAAIDRHIFQHAWLERSVVVFVSFANVEHAVAIQIFTHQRVHVRPIQQS